jgi:2-oxoglutarate ferredoxin oxidoreductase subunit beta
LEFKSALKPIWCPGCGDFGVLQALYRALTAIGRPPHEVAVRLGHRVLEPASPDTRPAYGFKHIHGARPADRPGHQARDPELLVLVAGGDGDGFSIGGGHVPTRCGATSTSPTS